MCHVWYRAANSISPRRRYVNLICCSPLTPPLMRSGATGILVSDGMAAVPYRFQSRRRARLSFLPTAGHPGLQYASTWRCLFCRNSLYTDECTLLLCTFVRYMRCCSFMVALCNRETIYIFMLWFVLLLFFPRLISAAGDWMFTILWHMVWP